MSSERLLALDGALGPLSAAYGDDTTTGFRVAQGQDALERGLLLIDELLTSANTSLESLDGIACSTGPGAFTGLRISLAFAKALAFARHLPLIGVSSYDVVREMLVTSQQHEPLLIAIRPRAGILSLWFKSSPGTVAFEASGPAAEVCAQLSECQKGSSFTIAAWPAATAQAEIVLPNTTLTFLPLRAEVPALALLRLANRRFRGVPVAPAAVHAIVAHYGEAPAMLQAKQ